MRVRVLAAALGLIALASTAGARDAKACGGCFHPPTQSGDVITDHRMIFRVTPQATTLYDEIEYSGNPQSFAWVLPTHGLVTVGLSSDVVFSALDQATVTSIQAPNLPACPSCGCSAPTAGGGSGSSGGGGFGAADAGVVVIGQQTVGPYDTVQLQPTAGNPKALEDWLTANGYSIPSDVQPIIAAYVNEGFDFLALKLAPGQGVSAMRPVRVTAPGAGLSLPLRMVAAGTGPTVGITLWVMADGRYEPANFQKFEISPAELVWDWSQQISNYTTVRAQKEAAYGNAAWQIESSLSISPYQVEGPVLASPVDSYLPIPASDAGADAGAGQTAAQVRQDDLSTLFPGGTQGSVRVTRMRADLAHAALATDLVLTAPSDQSELSNFYQVTQSVHAPSCPALPNPCEPCGYGSSSGGSGSGSGGFGSSSGTSSGVGGSSGAGSSGGHGGSGCSTAPDDRTSGGLELGLAGLLGVALAGKRLRRGKSR